jgi:hypothetical protein
MSVEEGANKGIILVVYRCFLQFEDLPVSKVHPS